MDILGSGFEQLSPLIRKAHTGSTRLEGYACVEHGNLLARIVCKLVGMPPATERCPLVVVGAHDSNRIGWNRRFGDHPMNSSFRKLGVNLTERLGPIHMTLAVGVRDGALTYDLIRSRLFNIPIPEFLSPTLRAIEWQENDTYRFRVTVGLPLVGKLVSYFGDMSVETLTS